MSDIDDTIRGALDADDQEFLDSLDNERGILRLYGDTFLGPNSWIVWMVNALILAATVVGIYTIWGFLNAEGTESLIRWAAAGWIAWTLQITLKQWIWDRMNMIVMLREVKRLQVIVAAKD